MDLLIPAIDVHQAKLGHTLRLVAADAGFYSARNEAAAKAKRVKRVCIPNLSSESAARKASRRRSGGSATASDGVPGAKGISVSKRRHGLSRCRYRGDGMQHWVGPA
jgi:IS5 family transposase